MPHGFRSSFRDWAAEERIIREVIEVALAHVIQNKVEAAYARSDLFERRRRLMDDLGIVPSVTGPQDLGHVGYSVEAFVLCEPPLASRAARVG